MDYNLMKIRKKHIKIYKRNYFNKLKIIKNHKYILIINNKNYYKYILKFLN